MDKKYYMQLRFNFKSKIGLKVNVKIKLEQILESTNTFFNLSTTSIWSKWNAINSKNDTIFNQSTTSTRSKLNAILLNGENRKILLWEENKTLNRPLWEENRKT